MKHQSSFLQMNAVKSSRWYVSQRRKTLSKVGLNLRNPLLTLTLKLRGHVDLGYLVHCGIQMSEFKRQLDGITIAMLVQQ